ncbi:hypothetical protein BGZ93_000369 [Podila epicladia]|nr:hypothetical protein BG003_008671 [Podila horticola]KAG0085126.1 hypothetical protein BGZ92_009240 [Podila epicladia]KAG0098351.1 hypothetical protein BGZ93_000369 [Podila epicladia]
MAKGLRSKSARKYRAIKRETIFGPVETARVHRLAERLKKDAEGPKTSELEALARGEEKMEVEKDVEMVDEDKKISTSGRKDANHAKHKMAKEDRKKKNKAKLTKREMKKKSTFFRFHK